MLVLTRRVGEKIRLRAENARLWAWHDAVIGQALAGMIDKHGDYLSESMQQQPCEGDRELIIRPQPLAKE